MLAYYSIEEITQKSGLTKDQILRLGMSGTIVFSILEHAPKNYEEVDEFDTEGGNKVISTRTNETILVVGKGVPALKLKYLGPEDVINVVINDAPNRKTIVRALYETRELDPKKGTWFLNNPWRISLDDLVISYEEWEFFSKSEGKRIKHYLPLAKPEQVTLPWLIRNLSVSDWATALALAASLFGGGIYMGQTEFYEKFSNTFEPQSSEEVSTR